MLTSFLVPAFLYLYFPEDKTEYIPVVLELIILIIICVLVFRWLKRKSIKDAARAKEIEEQVMKAKKVPLDKDSTK